MSYTIDVIPNSTVLHIQMHEDFKYSVEGRDMLAEAAAFVDSQQARFDLIMDMGQIQFGFSDILAGVNAVSRVIPPFLSMKILTELSS